MDDDHGSTDTAVVSAKRRAPRVGRSPGPARRIALWVLGVVAVAGPVSGAVPVVGPVLASIQLPVLLAFVVVHASISRGWRGILTFAVVAGVIAFVLEASSVNFGFPFGYYTHHAPGPAAFGIPLVVPSAYIIYGWLAWILGSLIVRGTGPRRRVVMTPLVSAFVLVGWDFGYDAIGSTGLDQYTYTSPSGFMGVPGTNFFGWVLTGWIIYQVWALIEHRFVRGAEAEGPAFWAFPCVIWIVIPVQYLLVYLAGPNGVVERGGRVFLLSDVYEAASIAGILMMGLAGLAALSNIPGRRRTAGPTSDL